MQAWQSSPKQDEKNFDPGTYDALWHKLFEVVFYKQLN